MVLGENSLQEYLVNATVPQCSIFGPIIFLLYIKGLCCVFFYDIAIRTNDTSHYSKCDQVSDL